MKTEVGNLVDSKAPRDAIHVAIVAVQAGEWLNPGEKVTMLQGRAYIAQAQRALGVVDPFLSEGVGRLDWFYLFLNPGSITSLRHEWTHPAFAAEVKVESHQSDNMDFFVRIAGILGKPVGELLYKAEQAFDDDDGGICFGEDLDGWPSDEQVKEFWQRFANHMGKPLPPNILQTAYFSCAC